MGGGGTCSRIVRSRPGQCTGETIYETEDGRQWTDLSIFQEAHLTRSFRSLGYIHGNMICDHEHEPRGGGT